jgi:hypothetical protein
MKGRFQAHELKTALWVTAAFGTAYVLVRGGRIWLRQRNALQHSMILAATSWPNLRSGGTAR